MNKLKFLNVRQAMIDGNCPDEKQVVISLERLHQHIITRQSHHIRSLLVALALAHSTDISPQV